MRSEGDAVLESIDEAMQIGREAHIPVEIWHRKAAGKNNWGRMPEIIAHIEQARAQGVDISANTRQDGREDQSVLPPTRQVPPNCCR
jgi:N-acyl-D-amino-acid deacylase